METLALVELWAKFIRYGSTLEAFLGIFVVCAILINLVAVYAGLSTLIERKIAAHMQARVGPYRVGPHGVLQWMADALKLMIKEDIVPTNTDKFLFRLSPYIVFGGAFACWVALPYAPFWSPSSFNIGVLYLLAVSSAGVIGILMAGWSSGNKWALFGAMRAAAQIVSYEVPVGITLLGMLLIYGSLDMHQITWQQQKGFTWGLRPDLFGGMYSWGVFRQIPFTIIAFIIFYIGALAETNRSPFDIPEAESELVSGYHTEYSGMRFSFFFLAEYGNMFVVSAIGVTFFLGGWLPFVPSNPTYGLVAVASLAGLAIGYMRTRRWVDGMMGAGVGLAVAVLAGVIFFQPGDGEGEKFVGSELGQFLFGMIWFVSKCAILLFVMMWLRWTLPRYRVDQLMDLCWKKLTPLAFINLLGIGILETVPQWWPLLIGLFTGGKEGA